MVRVKNSKLLMIFIYSMNIMASLVAIGFSIWLHFSDSVTLCQKVLQKPLLILGVPLLLVSVLVLVVSLCRVKFISCICAMLMLLIYLGLFCLSVFSILVTNRNVSKALFGRGGNYSHYLLRKYVVNAEDWKQIRSCLVDYKFCQPLTTVRWVDIYKFTFSDIQSSCCKPPTYCGLEFHNATYWTMPKTRPVVTEHDCKIWSNVQSELCFNCQSCKTAFLDHILEDWKIFSLLCFVLFLVLYSICCVLYCALRKDRSKGYQRHKVYPA